MRRNERSFQERQSNESSAVEVEGSQPRIVALTLAKELADAVKAGPEECQELVNAALCVGQWLADQGLPGRWDCLRPAEVLRGLDFLPARERERFLFSLVGLLGHAAFNGLLQPSAAKRAIDEVATLTQEDMIRTFALTAAAQLASMTV